MLHVHRAERADTLATALADVLATPPADPFAPDIIAVPARGVERWLAQHLSGRLGAAAGDGIAANISFPSPGDLTDTVIATASGIDPADDPWAPSRLTWTTLHAIDDAVGQPWCTQLTSHLDPTVEPHRAGRRYSTAALLTSLFRSYGADRPAMLRAWAAGDDTDGLDQPLPPDLRWQAQLWRTVHTLAGTPSPAERLPNILSLLQDEPARIDIPDRISVFGPTRLATSQIDILTALAAHRDVHLWLHHPSPALWDALTEAPAPATHRRDPALPDAVTNPLLASLGRDIRELQQRLPAARTDHHHPADIAGHTTLLAMVQDAIRDNRGFSPSTAPGPADNSIAVHACHGPARQVEVLREALLHTFSELPDLEPRDVLIMCPDINTYAPLVHAAFSSDSTHPARTLRVRVADRGPTATNPLLVTAATLLELADGRLRASELLDLAAQPPVAARFGFTRDDLADLTTWTRDSNIRWGISATDRARFDLPDITSNTASAGLDRLLLGATAEDGTLATLGATLPLSDIDSSDIDLAGRFAEFLGRTRAVLDRFASRHTAATWASMFDDALDLLTHTSPYDSWQRAQLDRELGDAFRHGDDTLLRLGDVRAMLTSRFAPRPTRSNFRTGELTVSTLVPMRSVPHRVIALLGLDDGTFPRQTHFDGDDVLARTPCIGERDPRQEDRQLLLDAVMAATDRLLITYTGSDPATGEPQPPAAPLADILDALAAIAGIDTVVRTQPLQPFDPASFTPPDSFSHDTDALAGARALQSPPTPAVLIPAPLRPAAGADQVEVSQLIDFLRHPQRAFLRQRLGVYVGNDTPDELPEQIPVELNGLQRWQIGDRIVTGLLAGRNEVAGAETARGLLPPGELGRAVGNDTYARARRIATVAAGHMNAPATSLDIALDLDASTRLWGTVPGVHGHDIVIPQYGRLHARQRLQAWVQVLAAAASQPGQPWQVVTVGWGGGQRNPGPVRSLLTAPDNPRELLAELAVIRAAGLESPLPIPVGTTAAFAERAAAGSSPASARLAGEREWQGSYDRPGEVTDPACIYLYGPNLPFAVLWDEPVTNLETSWRGARTGRFAALALRIWEPLLAHETLGSA